MKKLFKSPLLWVIVGEVIVMAVLTVVGFVFYNPDIEGSWTIVSAFAAWAGVIASTVAIFVAIQIPKKIAERQDKIALFEKRFVFYETVCRCTAFGEIIAEHPTEKECFKDYFIVSYVPGFVDFRSEDYISNRSKYIEQAISVLMQGILLFDFEDDLFVKFRDAFSALMITQTNDNKFDYYCSEYVRLSSEVEEKLLPVIEKTLKLTK